MMQGGCRGPVGSVPSGPAVQPRLTPFQAPPGSARLGPVQGGEFTGAASVGEGTGYEVNNSEQQWNSILLHTW